MHHESIPFFQKLQISQREALSTSFPDGLIHFGVDLGSEEKECVEYSEKKNKK